MKQKIAAIVLSVLIILFGAVIITTSFAAPASEAMVEETTVPTEPDYAKLIQASFLTVEYNNSLSIDECEQEIEKLSIYITSLLEQNQPYEQMIEYVLVTDEIIRVEELQAQYKEDIVELEEQAFWDACYAEYPTATEAWLYMKNNLGYNDIVCAGIMGNLMAETGGRSLQLDWDSNGGCGYGLIQWLGNRRSLIKELYGEHPTTENQMRFMHNELFGLDGVRQQVTERQLSAIMDAESPEDCAYAFACYFERCATEYRSFRRGLARQAYEYFVR